MAFISLDIDGGGGSKLYRNLAQGDINPGDQASYELCKQIYVSHPFGDRMTGSPVESALRVGRNWSLTDVLAAEEIERVIKQEWDALGCLQALKQLGTLSRVFGVAGLMVVDADNSQTNATISNIETAKISFNVVDPLVMSGSLGSNQDPNRGDFMRSAGIVVNGSAYHQSRGIIQINAAPVYLEFSSSGFGFTGQSVYRRALAPLAAYLKSMDTRDQMLNKAGALIVKTPPRGSTLDGLAEKATSVLRGAIKRLRNSDVMSIDSNAEIAVINLQGYEAVYTNTRRTIIEDLATAAGMPAQLILGDSLAQGFGNGSEDLKRISQYLEEIQASLDSAAKFLESIVLRRALSQGLFELLQKRYPTELGTVSFNTWYYDVVNKFESSWNKLTSDDKDAEEKAKQAKGDYLIRLLSVAAPLLDKQNQASLLGAVFEEMQSLGLVGNVIGFDPEAMIAASQDQGEPALLEQ